MESKELVSIENLPLEAQLTIAQAEALINQMSKDQLIVFAKNTFRMYRIREHVTTDLLKHKWGIVNE